MFKRAVKEEKNVEIENSIIENLPAEMAQIESIKLRRVDEENSYFEVELVDEEGKSLGVFGSPYITDAINFRREVFGLLKACGTNDFLKLGQKENISIPITFRCNRRNAVSEICNENNQTFHLNQIGEYVTEPTIENNFISYEGAIDRVESAIDTLNMRITDGNSCICYVSGNVHYGFGYPLITMSNNPELIKKASKHYKEYIENMLKFFGTDDLLRIGGEPIKLPEVLIERDESGNIIAIGREGEENHLRIMNNDYKIEKESLVLINNNKKKKLI